MIKNALVILTVFVLGSGFSTFAQSLLDNPDYLQAKELQKKARDAMDAGDYDAAAQYAEESKTYLQKSDAFVALSLLRFKANGKIQAAEEKLARARGIGAEKTAPEKLAEAVQALASAKELYGQEQYESSIESADRALILLEDIRPEEVPPGEILPRYYTVRLIPGRRDCFWRIAEYDFVYGDPWQWPVLYEANKDKLENPENPRIIEPGMVFEIPSISGEIREGPYQPVEE